MGVKVREKRGKLYLDIYQAGKRTWEALGLSMTQDRARNREIMRIADVCRSKREAQLLSEAWDIRDPVRAKIKFAAYIEEYSKTYKTPSNVTNVIRHIEKFCNGAEVQVCQITPVWVERFQQHLLKNSGLSHASAVSYSKTVRTALRKAVGAGIIQKSPADQVAPIREEETDKNFLNPEEVQRLADVRYEDNPFAEEVRRAFLFACNTGLRVSDLETISWKQIERNPMQIIKKQEKTRSPVYVPLNRSARKLLGDDGRGQDGMVFGLPNERRPKTYRILRRWAEAAHVDKRIGWHTARRTFATLALENGVDIYTVAKLLGHKTIAQVAKYAKATDRLRREAVNALPELNV